MHELFLKERDQLGIQPGLERINSCLNYLENPQNKFKSVFIGGTNGKGSVTFYLSNLSCNLTNLKIGRFISPHLITWNERFVINENIIDQVMLKNVSEELIKRIKEFEKTYSKNGQLTSFEIYTIIAFYLFAKENVDIGFFEAGMGGRLDSTNVLNSNNVLCSVITNVSYDHMDFLGNTIEKIAYEKAGIIKQNNHIITGAEGGALKVIENKAKELKATLIKADYLNNKNKIFYQDKNIDVALKAWEVISSKIKTKNKINNKNEYLKSLQFPGRYQFFENEKIILDGAHNPQAAYELRRLLDNNYKNKIIIYIIGILDKDYKTFIDNLITYQSTVICTEPKSERATKKEIIAQCVKSNDSTAILAKDIKEAIQEAKGLKHDFIVITGSLYLIGEALELLQKDQSSKSIVK